MTMSERNRAIETLRGARERLIEEITDLVNNGNLGRDDLAEELSNRFMSGGGDGVLELGDRLNRLNILISAMPSDLPEPSIADSNLSYVVSPSLPTWNDFLDAIAEGNNRQAGILLTIMTGLDPEIAEQCANVFQGQYSLDPHFTGKANSLRAQLRCNVAGSLVLIKELFGVTGQTAVTVYQGLRVAS